MENGNNRFRYSMVNKNDRISIDGWNWGNGIYKCSGDINNVNKSNISFVNELYNIKTLLPTILTNTLQDGGGIMKVKLKYGEITHDFTTGQRPDYL